MNIRSPIRFLPRLPSARALVALLVALTALLLHGLALADAPTRAGRIADLSGAVWLYDADAREWVEMHRNQTVGEGDRLRADDGAGATLTVGSSTLWLDQRSEIEFNALSDNRVAVQIIKGSAALRLRSQDGADEWTLRTLEGRFAFEREGLYRVSQLDRGSQAQAWQGKLRFDSRATDAQPVWMSTNEQAEFWWDNGPRTERQPLQRDGFARLFLDDARDAMPPPPAPVVGGQPYVSPEMTGAEDLGQYGAWQQSPDYGPVWVPTVVVADWAPYRYGRWVWSSRWSWTWVDDMPWGFAPFHYGRWAYWRDRWCWVPGPYVRRPVYSPAMVGWVGGSSISMAISIGSGRRPPPPRYGAWVPLAPREAWIPPYHYSPGYWRRANPDPHLATVVRPGSPPPIYRNEREHGPLYTQRPVAAPLPAAALQPQRSWPPRPGTQTEGRPDGRPDGRPFVDRNHDGRPDNQPGGRPFIDRDHDGRPDARPDVRNEGRPGDAFRNVVRPAPEAPKVVPQPTPNVPGQPQGGRDVRRPQERSEGDREAWRAAQEARDREQAERGNRGGQDGRRGDRQDRREDQPARVAPPRFEQPRVEQPRVEQPRVEQPRFERPERARPEPQREMPRVEAPRMEPPRVEAPRPAPQAPRVEAPRPSPPPPQRVEPPRPPRNDGPNRDGNNRTQER
ncbi:MAG: hypothetical protein J7598_16285 [Mitsuaria chitosanitabida]|uniref:DUF6600 domain-containing protein n=1 Tax=Roseateles chitosanitabidus TaxID=65048 RepID=UPI001B2732BC|nr:DUF6600 domain-containing protein [Roseateles chitosanitabidus]MBO9688160.1 hypothetical protein [Roseateles chitosanitabidus]